MAKENGGKGGGASKGAAGKGGGDTGARASIEEEILSEAQGDEGDADGLENEDDAEDDDAESESADDAGDDDGTEGEEDDGDRSEDDGSGDSEEEEGESEEDVDGDDSDGEETDLKTLFVAQSKQMQELLKTLAEKPTADRKDQGMTDDQWAGIEEQTGMKKAAVQFISDRLFKPALNQLAKNFAAQINEIKGAGVFDGLAKDPNFKGVQAYRGRMEKFLENFAPEVRQNKTILRMAYLAAKGMGAKKAVQEEANRRELRKKITVKGRPGAGGAGVGGGKSRSGAPLTAVQRQAMKLGGMTESEYRKNQGPRRK